MTARPEEPSSGAPDEERWWRREGRYLLEILALTGFAIAQPVLSSFGDSPETFVTSEASTASIVAFGVAVVLVPPLAIWGLATLTALAGRAIRRAVQAAVVGVLVATLVAWASPGLLPGRAWVVAAAVALGALAVVAYRRLAAARWYLSFASVAPVAFLAVFLALSPVANLVSPPKPAEAGEAVGDGQPSVVTIVLDELPTASLLGADDRVDAELFPNIARLAGDATFYRNHTGVGVFTDAALPALLTGRYPTGPTATERDYRENLFTLLGDTHQLNVHEAITSLCPAARCDRETDAGAVGSLGSQAWELWAEMVTGSGPSRDAATAEEPGTRPGLVEIIAGRYDLMEDFLPSLQREGARPRLDFAHVLFPHVPWERLPDGRPYEADAPPLGNAVQVWGSETSARLGRQRHLLQLQYTDARVGQILDRLDELDRYDDSYVFLLADHGISFEAGEPWRSATRANHDEILWTPLFVKAPGQDKGRVSDLNAQSVDLVPTIAEAVGLEIPWEVDGRSLLSGEPRTEGHKRFLPSGGDFEINDDPLVRIDGEAGYRSMLAAAPPFAAPRGDPLALYRLPPHSDLVGSPVADLPVGGGAGWGARLVEPDRYDDVGPDGPLPAYVSGEVVGDVAPARLAVAVNGTIGGWGAHESVEGAERARFGVLVPPALLQPGANTIEVFAMEGEPGAVTLRPVELVP